MLGTLVLLEHSNQITVLKGSDGPEVTAGVDKLLRYLTSPVAAAWPWRTSRSPGR
ncbi:hypothetical protein GCM10010326_69000 [Streptomyces xanthochromogenes]|uniref:Uncharacterized protein n=1 Tax=Streptomyces xanthochromogenes TaxID=67384 RepID=A0ABQ3AQX2_9ACTN|nr:hypothetical protein GCM10010326_69000 [Streptomyces xanthochromogenes]